MDIAAKFLARNYYNRYGGEIFAAYFENNCIAVFFDSLAAMDFRQEENDAVEADIIRIEPIALFDRYGFPIRPQDIPAAGIVI